MKVNTLKYYIGKNTGENSVKHQFWCLRFRVILFEIFRLKKSLKSFTLKTYFYSY